MVAFEGTAWPEPWAGASNADCKALHGDTIQLVKARDGKLGRSSTSRKACRGLPPAGRARELRPEGLRVLAQVFGVFAGQPINAGQRRQADAQRRRPVQPGLPFGVKRTMKLNEPCVMATIKSDVHPWMRSYAGVMEHPYFAVTKEDGAFEMGS